MVAGEIPGTTPDNIRLEELTLSGIEVLTLPGEGVGEQPAPSSTFIEEVKLEAKMIVNVEDTEQMFNHVTELVKQGKVLELSQLEKMMQPGKGIFSTSPGEL